MTLKRWKLTMEYKGTDYSGWQRQNNAPSIQQHIENALYKFCQKNIRLHAAGRTDAGVHAKGQIAHFDLDYGDRPLTGYDLAKAINAHLREQAITITKAEAVAPDFHARFQATNKRYLYRIICRSAPPALDQDYTWHFKRPLNVPSMQDAAQMLLGHHDFTTFRATECQSKSPVKTLDRLDVEEHIYDEHGGKEIRIYAEARSFLHHQVRNMVGTLCLVGEGKWAAQDVKDALEAKDRTKGGPTAPPEGLYLEQVFYDT